MHYVVWRESYIQCNTQRCILTKPCSLIFQFLAWRMKIKELSRRVTLMIKCIRPVNLHPLFLKIGHPDFWKMGHPAFFKKQAEKNRVILYSKREETRLPLFFLNYNELGFLHSVFFEKQGAQFLRIVGADWLVDCVMGKTCDVINGWPYEKWFNHRKKCSFQRNSFFFICS